MKMRYVAFVHKDPDSSYGISFPDFPGCISAGDTIEEAVANGTEALSFHVKGMVADGEAIPEPRSPDDIAKDPALVEERERLSAEERAKKEAEERAVWEQLATDNERRFAEELTKLQTHAAQAPKAVDALVINAAAARPQTSRRERRRRTGARGVSAAIGSGARNGSASGGGAPSTPRLSASR